MQGTEEEAEAEDTAEIWTSGEEVSDFGTDVYKRQTLYRITVKSVVRFPL